MDESKRTVLDVAKGDADAQPTIADISFCESSTSVTVNGFTVHIPWTEMATWQMWLAERIQAEA